MALCNKIAENVNACVELSQGNNPDLYIINMDDFGGFTEVDEVITSITLPDPLVSPAIFKIEGKKRSLRPYADFVDNPTQGTHSHTIEGVIFDISAAGRKVFNAMANGNFVCIIENNDDTFDIVGLRNGLEMSTDSSYNRHNADTKGAIAFTLKTPSDFGEKNTIQQFEDTDYDTTKAFIEANLAP